MSNRCWFAIIRGTTYFMLKGSASWQGKEATNVIVVNKPDPLGDKVLAHNEVSILDLYDSDPILLMLLMVRGHCYSLSVTSLLIENNDN